MGWVRWIGSFIFPNNNNNANPNNAATVPEYDKFINKFVSRYATVSKQPPPPHSSSSSSSSSEELRYPNFFRGTYNEAVSHALTSHRLLFVYLHSQQHSDTTPFCTDTLCSAEVLNILRDHYVVYGADIWSKCGYDLTIKLGAEAYPFVAIIFPGRDTSSTIKGLIISTLNGYCDAQTMVSNLKRFITSNEIGSLWTNAAHEVRRRQEVMEDQQLRNEQEQAYQESLRADIEREKQKEVESKRMEEEKERAEKEKLEQIRKREEKKKEKMRMREVRRAAITPEPPSGTKDSTMIAIRLPAGRKAVRRFLMSDLLTSAFGFADREMGDNAPMNFTLCINVPKKTFTWEDAESIKIGSLGRQLLMNVQEIDDDDEEEEEEDDDNNEKMNEEGDDDDDDDGKDEL